MPSPLFNIPTPKDKSTESTQPTTGVLNSSQGAATFLGAPAAVTVMWKVLKAVFSTNTFINTPACGALLATVVGICIWFASSAPIENDTSRAKMGRSLAAVFSIFAIIAATLGINPKENPPTGSGSGATNTINTPPAMPTQTK